MKSLDIIDFELSIKKFVQDYDLPAEVKRMVIKNIYEEVTNLAQQEVLQQAQERDETKKKQRTIYHEDKKEQ